MKYLEMYMLIAKLQADRYGRAVGVKDLMGVTKYSRSQIYRYLNALMESGFIIRPKRGKYYLKDCIGAQSVGFSVLTPLEIFAYTSKMNKNGNEK